MTNLTKDEMQIIVDLADLATKAGGLQVAMKALPIVVKLQAMAAELDAPAEPPSAEPRKGN